MMPLVSKEKGEQPDTLRALTNIPIYEVYHDSRRSKLASSVIYKMRDNLSQHDSELSGEEAPFDVSERIPSSEENTIIISLGVKSLPPEMRRVPHELDEWEDGGTPKKVRHEWAMLVSSYYSIVTNSAKNPTMMFVDFHPMMERGFEDPKQMAEDLIAFKTNYVNGLNSLIQQYVKKVMDSSQTSPRLIFLISDERCPLIGHDEIIRAILAILFDYTERKEFMLLQITDPCCIRIRDVNMDYSIKSARVKEYKRELKLRKMLKKHKKKK